MSSERASGIEALKRGDTGAAIERLRRACEQSPSDYVALFYLGAAYSEAGRHEEAVRALSDAVGLQPKLAEAHYRLGSALEAAGRPREAVAALEKAIALQPKYARANESLRRLDPMHPALQRAALAPREVGETVAPALSHTGPGAVPPANSAPAPPAAPSSAVPPAPLEFALAAQAPPASAPLPPPESAAAEGGPPRDPLPPAAAPTPAATGSNRLVLALAGITAMLGVIAGILVLVLIQFRPRDAPVEPGTPAAPSVPSPDPGRARPPAGELVQPEARAGAVPPGSSGSAGGSLSPPAGSAPPPAPPVAARPIAGADQIQVRGDYDASQRGPDGVLRSIWFRGTITNTGEHPAPVVILGYRMRGFEAVPADNPAGESQILLATSYEGIASRLLDLGAGESRTVALELPCPAPDQVAGVPGGWKVTTGEPMQGGTELFVRVEPAARGG